MSAAENAEATTNLALHSLTGHMVDHHLPAPRDLNIRPEDRCIQIYIYPEHLDAWLESGFHVDTENITPLTPLANLGGRWERVDVNGHIDASIGAIAIRLSWPQRTEATPLRVVKA